jgi:uncharacterized membrane protein YvlD (DUF360 family)
MRLNDHFLSWTLIFSLSIYISKGIIDKVTLSQDWSSLFLAGFIMTLISWVMYSILYKNRFVLDKYFVLWIFIHSLSFWVTNWLLELIKIQESFLYFFIFGLMINIITWIIKRKLLNLFNLNIKRMLLICILIFLFLGLIFPNNVSKKNDALKNIRSGALPNIFNEIGNFFDTEVNYTFVENEIFILVNNERKNNGINSLVSSEELNQFARKHSTNMVSQNSFQHSNANIGENIGEVPIHSNVIGCGSTYSDKALAECFVKGWIKSPGHHENMINDGYSISGVGVACDNSKCRATQVFE